MPFNINDVQANFKFEGARPTLFDVHITNPVLGEADQVSTFLISATTLPESTLGNIPVPYFGRVINFGGDRTYAPWQVTVMNDEDFKIRNAMETWSNAINKRVVNKRDIAFADNHSYKSTALVTQYNKVGDIVRVYRFNGIYPAEISDINLDWSDTNTFERFQIRFIYDYWDIAPGGNTKDAGGLN